MSKILEEFVKVGVGLRSKLLLGYKQTNKITEEFLETLFTYGFYSVLKFVVTFYSSQRYFSLQFSLKSFTRRALKTR